VTGNSAHRDERGAGATTGAGGDRGTAPSPPSRVPRSRPDDRDALTRLRERSVLRAYKAATWTLGHAPQRASWEVGGILAQSTYLAWPARRRATRSSFAHVLGRSPDDPRVDRLARRMYRNYAQYIVELMRLPTRPRGELVRELDMMDAANVETARDLGRGVIMVGAHIGFMEGGAAAIADRGWVVSAIADDSEFIELFEHLSRQRAAWGIRLLPMRNLREMYATLRRGELIGLLVDWGYRPDGIPVRIFGDWTTLPAGPATLAARTGAVIVPISVTREVDGEFRYRGRTSPYIEVSSIEPSELARATQLVADAIEEAIRRHPDQWWVFKPMWPETGEERADLMARLPEFGLTPDGTASGR
jgi:lauroyl/myristoyl acyltransferase